MKILSRRTFLAAGALGSLGSVVTSRLSWAAPAASDVIMWRLNPDWGTPLTTDTGSSTKSRCRGAACHTAAPNRFFLTRADALAGRLHPCCLAQPEQITVCIDLNALMPYYTARLGGIDGRCAQLPEELRSALYAGSACVVDPVTTDVPGPSSSSVSPTTAAASIPTAAGTSDPTGTTNATDPTASTAASTSDPLSVTSTQPTGVAPAGQDDQPDPPTVGVLPATGSTAGTTLAVAAAAVAAAGVALVASTRHTPPTQDESEATP